MDFKIAVLAGDGIGPEISAVGVDVMTAVCEKFGWPASWEICMQVRKQQLELDMEQQTSSK